MVQHGGYSILKISGDSWNIMLNSAQLPKYVLIKEDKSDLESTRN
jgi:hypothetical protein